MRTFHPGRLGRFFNPSRLLAAACMAAVLAPGTVCSSAGAPEAASKLSVADEAAIRALAEAYTKAYDAADAKALAALWTADAEYVDDLGQEFHGRDAIVRALSSTWSDRSRTMLEVSIASIRQLAPGVAIETGTSCANRPTATRLRESNTRRCTSSGTASG